MQLPPSQVFVQVAPDAQWKLQLRPAQVFAHVDPVAQ
jgi:hypothetical protein